VMSLGPAQLQSEFSVASDGAVHATWRFDTVKGRYTPTETEELAKALHELDRKGITSITFDQVGVALSNEGKYKEALQANEALIAKYPRKAVHRLRYVTSLLDAGLGTRAQREALAATRLEPKSALAWKTLGWTLQQDAVGRRFGTGYDRAGAIAAYRKARALAPDDTDIAVDFGVLLEYDANGQRYSSSSNLDEAIKTYQERRAKLSVEEAKDDDYATNLYFAMLYARRFPELRDLLRDKPQTATNRSLNLAALAAEKGSAPALELARSQVGVEKERFAALTSAGNLLFRLREYPAAADLLEAGSRGETNTAATTQRIAFLRKTKRDDGKSNPLTDPRGVTIRWFAEMLSGLTTDPKNDGLVTRLLAPGSEVLIEGKDSAVARRMLIASLARQDIPIEVAADLMFSNMRVNVEGDDAHGYRVQLRTPGATQTFYVVSLAGTYRILAMAPTLGPLATKALESIDANDLGGARKWLDWARADSKPASADDPLAGPAFPRAWTVGADSDLAGARIAAIVVSRQRHERTCDSAAAGGSGRSDERCRQAEHRYRAGERSSGPAALAGAARGRHATRGCSTQFRDRVPTPAIGVYPSSAMGRGRNRRTSTAGAPAGRSARASDAGAPRRGARNSGRGPRHFAAGARRRPRHSAGVQPVCMVGADTPSR